MTSREFDFSFPIQFSCEREWMDLAGGEGEATEIGLGTEHCHPMVQHTVCGASFLLINYASSLRLNSWVLCVKFGLETNQ